MLDWPPRLMLSQSRELVQDAFRGVKSVRAKEVMITILMTPAYHAWYVKDHQFVKSLLQSVFGDARDEAEVSVITGIVDKIAVVPPRYGPEGDLDARASHSGSEGITVLVVADQQQESYRIWSSDAPPDASSSIKTGYFSVAFDRPFKSTMVESPMWKPVHCQYLDIELADTTMLTGRRQTIYAQQWRFNGSSLPVLAVQRDLDSHRLNLRWPDRYTPGKELVMRSDLAEMLTPPRKIVSCLGNVINTVQNDENSIPAALPASEELEASVNSWRSHHPDEAWEIWALVTPAERMIELPHPPMTLPAAFRWGGQAVRVSGGGGGWGTQRGLISLDIDSPVRHEGQNDLTNEDVVEFPSFMTGDHNHFKSGDTIQFVAIPVPNWPSHATPFLKEGRCSLHDSLVQFRSTSRHSNSTAQEQVPSGQQYLIQNFFGVATTGKMHLTSVLVGPPGKDSWGSVKLGQICATRVPPRAQWIYDQAMVDRSL